MIRALCSHLLLALLVVRQVDQAVSAIPDQVDHLVPAYLVHYIDAGQVTFEAPSAARQLLRE